MAEERTEALERFLKNPYWRKYYETAPSDECREWIGLGFYASAVMSFDEVKKERQALEDKLKVEDWKHILKFSGNNPSRIKYKKKIEELENNKK